MNKPLHDFFTKDHRRIEDIFERATKDPSNVDLDLYQEFRTGLLTHIKMEEKILFIAAKEANQGKPIPLADRLRLEHGALTALMVVYPTPEVIKTINYVMEIHDLAEEEPGGMYDICESLTENETEEILKKLQKVTPVPLNPINPTPNAMGAMKRALARAGFDYDKIVNMKK